MLQATKAGVEAGDKTKPASVIGIRTHKDTQYMCGSKFQLPLLCLDYNLLLTKGVKFEL